MAVESYRDRANGYNIGWFGWTISFCIFEIKFFCFVVAVSDLAHDVEALHGLCYLLTASEIFSEI